ncbi:MAG TPA: AAA family ATPase, partial [Planctomycetota bacterium]|nr:AAA family ATPase [Planctomycetota bacterium]
DILVLDEPTTGLDPRARRSLWDKLIALGERGTTIVLTTHYMDEAEKLCDRLVVMDEGRIVAEGTPKGLIAEHVPPHVLEVVVPEVRERKRLAADFGALALAQVELADRMLFYGVESEALLRRYFELGGGAEALVRGANLEDVFLALTGHGLS